MAGGVPIVARAAVNDRELTGAAALTLRQSLLPCALVTTLFFLWGFAYGLLDVLNAHFQSALNITKSQSSALQGAYFGAYFFFPLTFGGPILRRFGYKITFMTGLCIFGVGCFCFWPSGIYSSFAGFCGSMAVVGWGLSTLEVSANPYLATCGPPKYSEIRLSTAQAVQAIGTVVAPVLASYVFFKNTSDLSSLKNVQWVYLGVGCFVFVLAFAFFFAPIPEITDADMELQATSDELAQETGPLSKQITLFWGVAAQFCYVGAQCAVAGFFINYSLETGRDHATSSNLLAVAQGLFAIGRFSAAGMMKFIKPRYVLAIFSLGTCVFSILAMNIKGTAGLSFLNVVFFFESCCFPLIFTLAIKKLGKHTKLGSSFLVSSISGGAVWPQLLAQVADRKGTHFAMLIPFIGFTLAFSFPVYVNLFQRERMDVAFEAVTPSRDEEEKSIDYKFDVTLKE
ncbi:hypothetical protein H072_5255 [Dactylellina haptotyla CBS 200.50]|uniref:Major facilitator superfamily (MFS) profile domain-containing protein n=1 Tax=Dactylellina haptotyla (strain CBS 200.50) TaxID=1284197 RepID=S8AD45_DACHA|nr:hypothetical protein H072_5255 [Dactylellina haptotyla CBS 200.50]